jgi:hypothetical protein
MFICLYCLSRGPTPISYRKMWVLGGFCPREEGGASGREQRASMTAGEQELHYMIHTVFLLHSLFPLYWACGRLLYSPAVGANLILIEAERIPGANSCCSSSLSSYYLFIDVLFLTSTVINAYTFAQFCYTFDETDCQNCSNGSGAFMDLH